MTNTTLQTFYQQHKSLVINIFSVLLLLGVSHALGEKRISNLNEAPWVGIIFIIAFLLEPWATYYSMGAYNERRIKAGIQKPIRLQRWIAGNFITIGLFWIMRCVLLGGLMAYCIQSLFSSEIFENQVVTIIGAIIVMVREGYVVYYLLNTKPKSDFREDYDFMADIILAVMLMFGQLMVSEIFRDIGMQGMENASSMLENFYGVIFLLLLFYLPIRYLYTLEDFTFARTKKEKIERIIAFLVMVLGFLLVF